MRYNYSLSATVTTIGVWADSQEGAVGESSTIFADIAALDKLGESSSIFADIASNNKVGEPSFIFADIVSLNVIGESTTINVVSLCYPNSILRGTPNSILRGTPNNIARCN